METHIEELYNEGMQNDSLGQRENAIKCFQDVMAVADKTSNYYRSSRHNLACQLVATGKYDDGIKLFEESAADNHPASLYYLGVHYERRNDCRAIGCYIKSANLGNADAITALKDLGINF